VEWNCVELASVSSVENAASGINGESGGLAPHCDCAFFVGFSLSLVEID
jgi:hypothetical protein